MKFLVGQYTEKLNDTYRGPNSQSDLFWDSGRYHIVNFPRPSGSLSPLQHPHFPCLLLLPPLPSSRRTHLQVRDDLPAHDGLELSRADLAGRIAQRAVARHVYEVRLGHVDPVVLHPASGGPQQKLLAQHQKLP